MTDTRLRQGFLLLLLVGISLAFVAMIQEFLLTILLAAIFSGLTYPVYCRLVDKMRGRKALAAVATLLLLLFLVLAPLLTVLAAAANEAVRVADNVRPQIEQLVSQPGEIERLLRGLPGFAQIEPYRAQLLNKVGEILAGTSAFAFAALSATTKATAIFIFHFVVLLYTMFFFLTGGPQLLATVISYLPLADADKDRMLEKFVSV